MEVQVSSARPRSIWNGKVGMLRVILTPMTIHVTAASTTMMSGILATLGTTEPQAIQMTSTISSMEIASSLWAGMEEPCTNRGIFSRKSTKITSWSHSTPRMQSCQRNLRTMSQLMGRKTSIRLQVMILGVIFQNTPPPRRQACL